MFDFSAEISRLNTGSLKWDVKENELPMWVADMDFATAPCIKKAVMRRAEHGIYGYSIVPTEWYDAIIGWWKQKHNFCIDREWLQFSTGVIPAISSIVTRITNVGDNIAVMTPVYDIFFHSIENFGRHVLECKLDYNDGIYSIDFNKLEEILSNPLTTMLILCNPHNPIGKVWNKDELKIIGEMSEKYGVTVLSDEIHCDITDPNISYIPFASVSERCKNNSVTCISASKAFNLAGLQSAAVCVSNPVLRNKIFRGLNSNEVAEPNCFAIGATISAFTEGEQWLKELNGYIYDNKLEVKKILNIPQIKIVESQATYLLWIDCSNLVDSTDDFCGFLKRSTGLYISPGSQYRGNGKKFVRMNIACPRSRLNDGLFRFIKGINSYKC